MDYEFRSGDQVHNVSIEKSADSWRLAIDGEAVTLDAVKLDARVYSLLLDGRAVTAVVAREGAKRYIAIDGRVMTLEEPAAEGFKAEAEEEVVAGIQTLRAPMPGKVVKILASEGESVEKGQTVLVVEAMKMEHGLAAAGAGVVKKILCAEGKGVAAHEALAEVEIGEGQ